MNAAAKDVQEIQQDNKFTLQAAAATNTVAETRSKKTAANVWVLAIVLQHVNTRQPRVVSTIK